MTLPLSGPLSLSAIQTEFGGSNPININEYYRGGAYVPGTAANSGIPTSGTISIGDFYGGDATPATPTGTFSAANFTSQFNVATGVFVYSNILTLTVSNGPITVSVSGTGTPRIQKNSTGSYLTSISFNNGDTIRMRLTTSFSYDTTVTGTASMTGDTASFSATTETDPCFEASTLILMSDGTYKTLAQVQVGDMVMGYSTPSMIDQSVDGWYAWTSPDITDGANTVATVVSVNTHPHFNYYTINNDFKVSGLHPLLIKRDELWQWVKVNALQVGDKMWSDNHEEIEITSVVNTLAESEANAISVVSLNVENVDTYFVKGNTGITILAHNK
jgi:hypothetical protein